MDTDTEQRRQLVRRRADGKIWGVAAGVADYFSIDAIWVRLGFVLTFFAGGLGLVAYVTLRLLMPASDEPADEPRYGPREIGEWFSGSTVGTVIIALGLIVIATQIFAWSAGWFWGLALIGLGIWLFRERDEPRSSTEASAPDTARIPPYGVPPAAPGSDTPTAPAVAPAPPRRARRRRERSHLGGVTIGATLVVLGLMWLMDAAGLAGVRLTHYFAASLIVLGAGIAVGAWVGRARWLIIPALALVPLTVASSAISLPFEGEIGEAYIQPRGYDTLAAEYTHAIGGFTLDLLNLDPHPGEPVEVAVKIPVGSITIYAPADLAIEVRGRVGMGEVGYQGTHTGGWDLDRSRRFGPPGSRVDIRLDLQVSLGRVSVWMIEEPQGADR